MYQYTCIRKHPPTGRGIGVGWCMCERGEVNEGGEKGVREARVEI